MSLLKALSSILSQVASGTPIWKISVPASIHSPISAIQIPGLFYFSNHAVLKLLNSLESITDPLERLAAVVCAILDPNSPWMMGKPFNPVLGEYVHMRTTIDGEEYRIAVEQVSHHPPANCYRVTGPKFTLETKQAMSFVSAPKLGFNAMEIAGLDTMISITTSHGEIKYTLPGIKLDPLVGKQTAGYHGTFVVQDYTGIRFEGKVTKPFKLKGEFFDAEGKSLGSVAGDVTQSVKFKEDGRVWFSTIKHEPFTPIVDEKDLNDPKLSQNVWGKVFVHMKESDFAKADKEKFAVEEAQRLEMKTYEEQGLQFKSRFGFKYP